MAAEMVGTALMLQGILLGFLLTEALLYIWLWVLLSQRGMSGAAIAAMLLLAGMLWRLSHALGSFGITSLLRWRDDRMLPWGNALSALASEFAARFMCFNWSQPFQSIAVGADPCGNKSGVPILLVHGYVCNRGLWLKFRKHLAAAGLGPVYTVTLAPLFAGIDVLVPKLDARIEAICSETGTAQVMVVTHSMGGLLVRAYMANKGAGRISKLVTIGSPHHGTQLARLGIGINATQMRDHSAWLQKLEASEVGYLATSAAEGGGKQPATLSIYTLNDDLVYPPESSALAWAENVPVSAVGHMALVFSESVARRAIQHLR